MHKLLAVLVAATLGAVSAEAAEGMRASGLHIDPTVHIDFFQAAGVRFPDEVMATRVPSDFGGLLYGNHINLLRWGRVETLGGGFGLIVRDRPLPDSTTNQAVDLVGTVTLLDIRLANLDDQSFFSDLYLTGRYFWGSDETRGWVAGFSIGFDF